MEREGRQATGRGPVNGDHVMLIRACQTATRFEDFETEPLNYHNLQTESHGNIQFCLVTLVVCGSRVDSTGQSCFSLEP